MGVKVRAGIDRQILRLPWRVESPRNVTASKRLLFYLFFVIWTALISELLREGESGIKWVGLSLLELEYARSVDKRIWRVVGIVRGDRTKLGTASHEGRMK
jgi:hypothetical protein